MQNNPQNRSYASCSFNYLLGLSLEGGRQHVGEEFQSYRKQELHEGDDDKHQEGKKSEDVCTCSEELGREFGKAGVRIDPFKNKMRELKRFVCVEEEWTLF